MASYSPRRSQPSTSDAKYFSNNIFYQAGYGMPNCTCYAWGRFWEISGERPKLSTGNAGEWFGYTADGYKRSKNVPRLGAVMCWYGGGDGGHVAVVEEVKSDGTVVTSNSAWGGSFFYMQTLSPPSYTWSSSFHFQGFIYNPAVSESATIKQTSNKCQEFINEAKKHKGENGDWTWRVSGLARGAAWCAAFVNACAKTVGIEGKVFPVATYSCEGTCSEGVRQKMGTFLRGPYYGQYPVPQPGDCFILRQHTVGGSDYASDHIGIVTAVDTNRQTFDTAEGNHVYGPSGEMLAGLDTYHYRGSQVWKAISGYYRPNWSLVGGDSSTVTSYDGTSESYAGPLYDTTNTREDALMREVAFINSKAEPSISKKDIRLSVINYTEIFEAIYDYFGGMSSTTTYFDDDVDISGIKNTVAKTVAECLLDKGLTAAMVVGFLANMQQESGMNPAAVNSSSGASGLCQWLGNRFTSMVKTAGSDWRNNVSGQCEYLWEELNGSENATLQALESKVTTNDEAGAITATKIIVDKFERCGEGEKVYEKRYGYARTYWSQIVVQTSDRAETVRANTADLKDSKGNKLTIKKTVSIPNWVNQSGITTNHTGYVRSWAYGSVQRQLYEIWMKRGKCQNRNIATIAGYYLCALTLKLGTTGDAVTLVLEDGTCINCILGDSKGDDPSLHGESGNVYGHALGGGLIDVVEWEQVGTARIELKNWEGKKVAKVINYGSWLR